MIGPEGFHPEDPRQIIDTRVVREILFPEDPQARFEAIFAAIGNSEAKCVTLLTLQPYPITKNELHSEFLKVSSSVWDTSMLLQSSYVRQSLIPIGLVAQADAMFYGSSEFVTGYRLTEAGRTFGQPLAAFLLKQSLDLPYSLGKIFGHTSSSGTSRSPINRADILEYLNNHSDTTVRDTDMGRELCLDTRLLGDNLTILGAMGFAEYSSWTSDRGDFTYVLTELEHEKQIHQVRSYAWLTKAVAQIMFDIKTASTQQVRDELEKRYGKKFHNVGGILAGLLKQGLISTDFIGGSRHSKARITELGIRLVEDIVLPIKQVLAGEQEDILEEWRRIPWQDYAFKAIERYKIESGHANKRPIQEWIYDALGIILEHPGIRPIELKKLLNREVDDLLSILLKEGIIRKDRQGSTSRYYLT